MSKPYASLTELCDGDRKSVADLVRIFILSTSEDLKAMDRAVESRHYLELQQLAHRVTSACLQLDEMTAVAALQAIEYLPEVERTGVEKVVRTLLAIAKSELSAALVRASDFHSSICGTDGGDCAAKG
jgi:hypothetical protein